ncbi:hypothetical protein HMPREF9140_01081 [Prevotella micans F0438]|uniref:Uncharacterized protein n=1 Tax=Prevotella micans F0438 TaxID=883158 RepID=H1Q2E3_9BACT|nr:hypothetical protein [Prevotella micans]EHO70800.1 hypothetical protein HMPREF9140_01081 [Prevotella micans F0438]
MPDKWDDWHVRLSDPKEQLRMIDLHHGSAQLCNLISCIPPMSW